MSSIPIFNQGCKTQWGMKKNTHAHPWTPGPKVSYLVFMEWLSTLHWSEIQVQDPGEGELWLLWCGKRAARMVGLLVLATNILKD